MENAIEIKGLSKTYKGFALRDVTFAVPQGYIMGLIGPNGAGKTTIIKLIMNLIRRHGGEVRIFGKDNLRHETEIKARIGFVYDTPRFPEDIRLQDIARAIAPFYLKWDDRIFMTLIEEFELPIKSVFKKLSHGMKMKFSLAIALAHDADLILMDEPTAGLDPLFRFELLEKLRTLIQNERKTVLFSSHITTDLERIADYITFIHKGEIIFSETRDRIFENWGVVKVADNGAAPFDIPALRGYKKTAYNLEALTSDIEAARDRLTVDCVVEKASLEDIMFFISKGDSHV